MDQPTSISSPPWFFIVVPDHFSQSVRLAAFAVLQPQSLVPDKIHFRHATMAAKFRSTAADLEPFNSLHSPGIVPHVVTVERRRGLNLASTNREPKWRSAAASLSVEIE
jgi:hypothetical protein